MKKNKEVGQNIDDYSAELDNELEHYERKENEEKNCRSLLLKETPIEFRPTLEQAGVSGACIILDDIYISFDTKMWIYSGAILSLEPY